MKYIPLWLLMLFLLSGSCATRKDLSYLNNLPEIGGEGTFTMEIPDYRIQYRDILYLTIKAMLPDGTITDFLSSMRGSGTATYAQGEAGQYLFGYDVNREGQVIIPVLGPLTVAGLTLDEAREKVQEVSDMHFNSATVECKLLSFKFTVIGEVKVPGTYINYNNYLTVLEAIGRSGGISDFGRRDRILVVRPIPGGTRTYTLDLGDKAILKSDAYFLLPNDVIIVEAESRKIFNLNLSTLSFILTTTTSLLTTTFLMVNYFNKP